MRGKQKPHIKELPPGNPVYEQNKHLLDIELPEAFIPPSHAPSEKIIGQNKLTGQLYVGFKIGYERSHSHIPDGPFGLSSNSKNENDNGENKDSRLTKSVWFDPEILQNG